MRVSRALQTNERCPSGNARIPRTDRRFRPTPPSDGWPAPLAASPAPAERRRTSDTVVCNRTQFFLGALFTFLAIGMIWHDVKKWYRVRRSKAKRELFSWWGGVADNVIFWGGGGFVANLGWVHQFCGQACSVWLSEGCRRRPLEEVDCWKADRQVQAWDDDGTTEGWAEDDLVVNHLYIVDQRENRTKKEAFSSHKQRDILSSQSTRNDLLRMVRFYFLLNPHDLDKLSSLS